MAYGRTARPFVGMLSALPVLRTLQQPVLRCDDAKPKPVPKPFVTAKCTANEAHTSNTRLITLALPEKWNTAVPIANVTVRAVPAAVGEQTPKPIARPYNPLSWQSGNSVTILVKKYDGAQMGTKLHSLQVNEEVEVKGPNQQWKCEPGKYKHYAMVAGGTGITPLIQASEHILKSDTASVTMLTFNKTPDDVLLRKHLAQLQVMYPGRFKVVHFVEALTSSFLAGDCLEASASSPDALKDFLPAPADGVLVMVCGAKGMTAAVAGSKAPDFSQGDVGGVLKTLGYSESHVWKV